MNIVIDTNALYALMFSKDLLHEKALAALRNIPNEAKFITPSIVIAEILCAVREPNYLWKTVEKLMLGVEIHTLEDIDYLEKIKFSKRRSLKANDCLILALTDRLNGSLWTFDTKLADQAKSLGINTV